jgi:hypothetical protein
MILVVGVTWARYQEEQTNYLKYGVRESVPVSLWADYHEATGTLIEGEPAWTFYEGTGTLCFYISNGTSETEYSDADMRVSIRLLGSLAATDAQVYLFASDGNVAAEWSATPMQIQSGTPLFDTFGSGTAYVFLDEDGSELEWNLEGGSLSVLSVQLDVWNLENISDAALLQLQVVGK